MMNEAEFANIAAAEQQMWWFRGMRSITAALLDPLRLPPGCRVLEAGCGTGANARWLAQRYGAVVSAVDLSDVGLRYAVQNGTLRLAAADVRRLPFPSASFDLVTSFDVLVHFPAGEEGPAVEEMARVLRPGGLLLLRAAAYHWLRSRHSEFVEELQRFTPASLHATLGKVRLAVVRSTSANTLLLPAALAKFRIWEPLFQKEPSSGVVTPPAWFNRLALAALQTEAAWLRRGRDLPIGQSIFILAEKRR